MISVWNWIDLRTVTQIVGGIEVPNQYVPHFSIAAPEVPTPPGNATPGSSRSLTPPGSPRQPTPTGSPVPTQRRLPSPVDTPPEVPAAIHTSEELRLIQFRRGSPMDDRPSSSTQVRSAICVATSGPKKWPAWPLRTATSRSTSKGPDLWRSAESVMAPKSVITTARCQLPCAPRTQESQALAAYTSQQSATPSSQDFWD